MISLRFSAALFCSAMLFQTATGAAPSAGSVTIPVGLDAYRRWEDWPMLRTGVRAYMRSTYDRKGGNERADASHYLYQLAENKNVTLDVAGPGFLYFARYNHWHGSPWIYEVDGTEHVVQETSTTDPLRPAENSVFLPEAAFPNPLTWTWSVTKGADLSWVPIGFERSFRMMYGRTYYGTGYYIYHQVDPAAPLSRPVQTWRAEPPERDVLELISRAGSDLLPALDSDAGRALGLRQQGGTVQLAAGGAQRLVELNASAPTLVRALEFSAPRAAAVDFGRVRLRVTWDGAAEPSIDAPLALFHGAGVLHNRDGREFLVKAFPVNVRFDVERVHLACYFPMPFARSARIELVNDGAAPLADIQWAVRTAPARLPMEQLGYFHATYRDHPEPVFGEDLVLLDTRTVEGGGDWSGSLVGTSFIFTHNNVLNTLEGDPRFFFDDSQTPQAHGTGTEEWGGGGDYWGGLNMTLPFAGHPCGVRKAEEAKSPLDKIHSAYRFLLADLMPFGKNAVIRLEHGGENTSKEHYETVTFWYGRRGATLVKTDAFQPGDEGSEHAHDYVSPTAGRPYPLHSRYEWGPDTIEGKEIYPAHWELARTMTGTSEFTLTINPANAGVLLRRKLDYAFPHQRAEISIAPVIDEKVGDFKEAGVWYLAGSNTCLFSNVSQELSPSQHVVQTSNRRFRDDEFLVSRALTAGHSKIRVRVKFTPVSIPLMPGRPLPELAWSEIRYDAFSILPPR
ncbi:MAG TPA: DUF2961 domain-containing protein [Acidobacteriota bacterium]|nr:DUF2961 domain-containing protein [Acidobacteriota bacterium]